MDSVANKDCKTCRHSSYHNGTGALCNKHGCVTTDGLVEWEATDLALRKLKSVGRLDLIDARDNPYKTDAELKANDRQVGGSHYDMPIQPIEFIVKNGIKYREGNAIKYICRHEKKNGRQDIEKAIHYLEMILEDYDA